MSRSGYAVVVPTLVRPSLTALLESLVGTGGPLPDELVIVDDRPVDGEVPRVPPALADITRVRRSHGRGPAAARNTGWRETSAPWVVFLDDDVLVPADWCVRLCADLGSADDDVGGVQGRIRVPSPDGPGTDWERQTQGLATASWITADMAYRRVVLLATGGFDERFPRAYREDAELALRVLGLGWRLVVGSRHSTHPVREVGWWVSVRAQAGNADDVLLRRLHGSSWRARAGAPRGMRPVHALVSALGASALGCAVAGRRRSALAFATGWSAGVGWIAGSRVAGGSRRLDEVARMVSTSALLSPAAMWHWGRGVVRHRDVRAWSPPRAVLFDRDGTLVHDVPYNGDPAAVRPVDGAADVVRRLRARGVSVGVVTNQSGVGRGLVSRSDVRAVNDAVDTLVGPFDVWSVCPHAEDEGCRCRKPAPGMVLAAAERLGVDPRDVVVIGDTGADVEAGRRAGARAVLVPNARTRDDEVRTAPVVARDLREAAVLAVGRLP